MKRNLPKPPPPKTVMIAASTASGDAGQHRQEGRYDHLSPEPASGPAAASPEPATQRCALLGSVSPEPWPVTITWPAGQAVAVIGGQWQRLRSGRIEAKYHSLPELEIAITLTGWIREWGAQAKQAELLLREKSEK